MRHPAVRDRADARERKLRAAEIGLLVRQPLGIRRQPDRTRRLQRLGFERDVGEICELARERLVVLRPEVPQDVDILDHPLAPFSRRDVERGALRLPQRTRAAAGADDKPRAAVRQHVERGPFIGEDERIAQRERAHAGRAEQHPLGPSRHRREQRQRIEAAIDEQRIAAPNQIHHRACLDRIGEREEIAGAAKPERYAAVRQRDAEIHVTVRSQR